jgi:hypothetical protein
MKEDATKIRDDLFYTAGQGKRLCQRNSHDR